ncbi:MAG: hypothetical protein SFU56_16525 [Capsulimonadales bacterium]|nr:hypothetical protein [Capsulimonadales bacterium]
MKQVSLKNRTWVAPAMGFLVHRFVGEGKPVDVRLGIALLRDRRVPVVSKLLSVGAGIGLIALLEVLELPSEMLMAFLLPLIGFGINLALDGLEAVFGSFLLAAAILPHLAPREIVARVRAERAGPVPVRVAAK